MIEHIILTIDALWTWHSITFLCFMSVGCWVLAHGLLIVRLCKRREVEKDQSKT
jgi:hypothetical protein